MIGLSPQNHHVNRQNGEQPFDSIANCHFLLHMWTSIHCLYQATLERCSWTPTCSSSHQVHRAIGSGSDQPIMICLIRVCRLNLKLWVFSWWVYYRSSLFPWHLTYLLYVHPHHPWLVNVGHPLHKVDHSIGGQIPHVYPLANQCRCGKAMWKPSIL
jgi:hypothetical protein